MPINDTFSGEARSVPADRSKVAERVNPLRHSAASVHRGQSTAMKNALIVILSMALAIGAFLSRPTEDDFREFVAAQGIHDQRPLPAKLIQPARQRNPLEGAEFCDRILWVEIHDKDGKTLYAGVFNHWWDSTGRMQRV